MIMQVEVNSFDELMEHSWSGALDNLKMIDKYGLQDEFMSYLEEMFYDSTPTDTEINDAIWFDVDAENFIAEHTNIDDIEDIDELEQYAKDLCFIGAETTITDFKTADKEDLLWQYIQNNYANCGCSLMEVMQELDGFESAEDFEAEEE